MKAAPGLDFGTESVRAVLGGHGPNVLIGNEAGRMFLIPGKALRPNP